MFVTEAYRSIYLKHSLRIESVLMAFGVDMLTIECLSSAMSAQYVYDYDFPKIRFLYYLWIVTYSSQWSGFPSLSPCFEIDIQGPVYPSILSSHGGKWDTILSQEHLCENKLNRLTLDSIQWFHLSHWWKRRTIDVFSYVCKRILISF